MLLLLQAGRFARIGVQAMTVAHFDVANCLSNTVAVH